MENTVSKTEAQNLSEKMAALKQDFADVARLAKERAVTGTKEWAKEHPGGHCRHRRGPRRRRRLCDRSAGRAQPELGWVARGESDNRSPLVWQAVCGGCLDGSPARQAGPGPGRTRDLVGDARGDDEEDDAHDGEDGQGRTDGRRDDEVEARGSRQPDS